MTVLNQFLGALDELLAQVRPVLAMVGDRRGGVAAGILVGPGLVLTNYHVAGRHRSLQVALDDAKPVEAHVVASDPNVDLALLEVPPNGHSSAVLSTDSPRPGELVFAFGHPWGQPNVLTGGVLSAITTARSHQGEVPILRADVQLAPGNSGGPLINSAGEVIGINAMIFGGDQSVAIPASVIREFLDRSGRQLHLHHHQEAVL
jgi:serine protease Do